MEKKPFLNDTAVALVFFNRPECLKATFEAVAQARPSKLYLIQDGPRAGHATDRANVARCREIVENIDWACEVYRDYSEENLGCGARVFTGLTKAFETTDKLIIIEDDIVVSGDMIPFCKAMLDRYEDDQRIGMISGMNHVGVYDACPYSYFFASQGGAIWGWATWKRVWEQAEWSLECADDAYVNEIFPATRRPETFGKSLMEGARQKRKSVIGGVKQTSWSFQFGFPSCYLQSRLVIVPKHNLISNIGTTEDSAHSGSIQRMPRGIRRVYNAPVYPLPAPYVHPRYVVDDFRYAREQARIMGDGFFRSLWRKTERAAYRIFPFLGRL